MQAQSRSIFLDGSDVRTKREELRAYFHESFTLFESLFECLKDESVFYRQSEPTRHPMIFYYGHTAIFYVNKLVASGALTERINPYFETLFAVGVDEMTWDASSDSLSWPKVEEVGLYRNQVRHLIDDMIMNMPMHLPVTQDDPFWAIWMGIEHERIHIETSSVLHRQMPIEFVKEHPQFPISPFVGQAPKNTLIAFTGGTISLGKGNANQNLYGWDNEYGQAVLNIEPFEAGQTLVSNQEYLDFVLDGGYSNMQWWDEEGKTYLSIRKALCPPFWIRHMDGNFGFRTMLKEIDFPYNWPVEVNALEAEAFCRWKSSKDGKIYRLPTEGEWYYMITDRGMNHQIYDDSNANINLAHYASSVPVNHFNHNGMYDAIGNVWQWTQSQIAPYDGFKTHPWYDDFSEPTFDGKHNLIKGGSWISTGNEIVNTSRYAFRRHFIQHAGFRYVVGEGDNEVIKNKRIKEMFEKWKIRYA